MESMSPTPKPKETMDFGEAMREIIKKNRVTRLEWNNLEYYLFLNDGKLQIRKPDGAVNDLIVSEGDLNGDDYVLV